MGKEVSSLVKEPDEVTYDLYDQFMLAKAKDGKYSRPDVYPDKSLGLTVAVVHRPATMHYDLLFYRFDHMDTPVARITNQGDSMTLVTYQIGKFSRSRFSITEQDIQEKLKEMINSLK
jgi:hypothetical protein